MQSITKFFKEENDFFYKRGEEKKGCAVVENLLLELGLSDEHAARVAGGPVELVAKIRAELKTK